MENGNLQSVNPQTNLILRTIAELKSGNWSARAATADRGDDLDQIVASLNQLAELLEQQQAAQAETERRLEEFLEVLSGMAALDFSRKAQLDGSGSLIDAMAFGINMLSQELAISTVSRDYIDNIIESMFDSLIVLDPRGTIKTVNRAATRLFGYEKEELLDRPVSMLFVRAETTQHVLAVSRQAMGVTSEESTCRTKGGDTFPASLSSSAMYYSNAGNELQGIVCTIRDISERKQAEEMLRLSIEQEETIRIQAISLAELSTPLIPLSDKVVVMPLIGALDSRRAQQVLETLLHGISKTGASTVILDITGVPLVDTQVANALIHAAQAVKLLGARVILTGIRPEVAQTLVGLGIDLRTITTSGTLQSGIASVLAHR